MKNYLSICGLGLLMACQPAIDSRGNVTVEESFNSFVVGKTTMSDVLEKCGTPSLHCDNYSWIYVGLKTEEDRFKNVKSFYDFIVKITFNPDRTLKLIERIDPTNRREITMDKEVTRLIEEKQAVHQIKAALAKKS